MYDYKESKKRVQDILTSSVEVEEKDSIPADSAFTYSNGIKAWVGSLFVDIVDSSKLCASPDKNTAKILRAFSSEVIAILKDDSNYREIGIRGDCVYSINSVCNIDDLVTMFRNAYRINTFMEMFNKLLEKNGYKRIRAGIGLGCGQDLIVKAGHSVSGINDKIWVGKAVVDACNLGNQANRNGIGPIAMSQLFYDNIIDDLKEENPKYGNWIKLHNEPYTYKRFYHCNIIQTDMNEWIEGGMK